MVAIFYEMESMVKIYTDKINLDNGKISSIYCVFYDAKMMKKYYRFFNINEIWKNEVDSMTMEELRSNKDQIRTNITDLLSKQIVV